mgnify:CR=1 FL=1
MIILSFKRPRVYSGRKAAVREEWTGAVATAAEAARKDLSYLAHLSTMTDHVYRVKLFPAVLAHGVSATAQFFDYDDGGSLRCNLSTKATAL